MANAPAPAYVKYLAGEVEDALDAVYRDDETPVGRAFRNKFQFVIQTYCQQHDQAGEQTANFVGDLPCNSQFDVQGALGGLIVLRQTHEALMELLQDDADFRASYWGDVVTDDETDRHVRWTAREYEKDTQVSERVNDIVRRTAAEGEATEEEVMNASYDSDDGARVEFDIALSARDRLEPKATIPELTPLSTEMPSAGVPTVVPVAQNMNTTPSTTLPLTPVEASANDASASPHAAPAVKPAKPDKPTSEQSTPTRSVGGFDMRESPRRDVSSPSPAPVPTRPKRIEIVPQTHFGGSPSVVFNRAKEWFADMIVKVAAGSELHDEFPRITPLVDQPEYKAYGTTREELTRLAREIRDMTRRLRPPLSEHHEDLMDMMDRLIRKPGGGGPTRDEVSDILGSFNHMFGKGDDDTYGLGLNKNWGDGDNNV